MKDWVEITLTICGGIIVLMNLWNLIEQRVNKTKMPTTNLEERVSLLEKKLDFEIKATFVEYDARFGRDKQKIEVIERGNEVTQQAILALLSHAIEGNNEEEMKDARKALNKYLVGGRQS